MAVVRDTDAMIANMAPALQPGAFVFCTTADAALAARVFPDALALFHEAEGVSLILPEAVAAAHGFDVGSPMACLTLTVQSSLDGIGLTAAVAVALTEVGIACNMVAAYHHDHVFVPLAQAGAALAALQARAAQNTRI